MMLENSTITLCDDTRVTGALNPNEFENCIGNVVYENNSEHRTSSFDDDMSGMFEGSLKNSSVSILPKEVVKYKKNRRQVTEFEKNFLKMEEYSNFKRNWYGENEPPFDVETIEVAKKLLPHLLKQPEVFPARDGSVQMEFENEDGSSYVQINVCKGNISIYSDFGDSEYEENYDFNCDKTNIFKVINMYIRVF